MKHTDLRFSICVLTYNSGETILETLDSIYNIDYYNLELIISDDCSNDDTVYKSTLWLEKYKHRFVRTNILTVDYNTYTSANCNRALRESTGDWICLIAGDDILYPNSVSKIINFINLNPDAKWIIAKHHKFIRKFIPDNIIEEDEKVSEEWKNLFVLDSREQYKRILTENFISQPTAFCYRQILLDIGGYDEKYGILEDYPMNIKLLKNNIKCYFMDDYIMGYRMGSLNVCNNTERLFNIKHMRLRYQVVKDYCFEHYSTSMKIFEILKIGVFDIFYFFKLDRNIPINKFFLNFFLKICNILFNNNKLTLNNRN